MNYEVDLNKRSGLQAAQAEYEKAYKVMTTQPTQANILAFAAAEAALYAIQDKHREQSLNLLEAMALKRS
jgi:hypothetical protein